MLNITYCTIMYINYEKLFGSLPLSGSSNHKLMILSYVLTLLWGVISINAIHALEDIKTSKFTQCLLTYAMRQSIGYC